MLRILLLAGLIQLYLPSSPISADEKESQLLPVEIDAAIDYSVPKSVLDKLPDQLSKLNWKQQTIAEIKLMDIVALNRRSRDTEIFNRYMNALVACDKNYQPHMFYAFFGTKEEIAESTKKLVEASKKPQQDPRLIVLLLHWQQFLTNRNADDPLNDVLFNSTAGGSTSANVQVFEYLNRLEDFNERKEFNSKMLSLAKIISKDARSEAKSLDDEKALILLVRFQKELKENPRRKKINSEEFLEIAFEIELHIRKLQQKTPGK